MNRTAPARRWRGLAGLFTLALALRLFAADRAYDVHVDECYYVSISRGVAAGDGPVFQGDYFALHPPALFAVMAVVLRLSGDTGDPAALLPAVLSVRPVSACTGAMTVVAAAALLHRAVRPPIAWTAGLLLAMDPFLNRFDSRAFLESQATAATMLGLLVLARLPATARRRALTGAAAGGLFAVAVTTKDWYALLTFVPVTLLAVAGGRPARGMRLTAAAVTAAGYGLYVGVTAATGGWDAWREQKLDGLARAFGVKQLTGFNSPHNTTDLHERLLARADHFAVSYTLILLGACASFWLLWFRHRQPARYAGSPARSLITACGGCTFTALPYAVFFGTLEEQMFYPPLAAGVLALALAADAVGSKSVRKRHGSGSPRWRVAALPLVFTALALDATVWAEVHTRRDDAHRRLVGWVTAHVSPHHVVAATDDTVPLVLPRARAQRWSAAVAEDGRRTRYVVVSQRLVEQGYTLIDPASYAALSRRAVLVHREPGPTAGALEVYDVRPLTGTHSDHRAPGTSRPSPPASW
ncbi:phospholipid carrier-dependent glycosyltransferase [Streptomyces sp. NPDC049837]|uniref:ArnT family glycosyltransferase n=1 Tax=Streptomyces sp. NPDC049837 TaxID=3155277 RepID=UPI00341499AE